MKHTFFALLLIIIGCSEADAAINISTAVSIASSSSSGVCVIIINAGEPYSHANGRCSLDESGTIQHSVEFAGFALGYPFTTPVTYKTWETLDVFIEHQVPICSRFEDVIVGHVSDSNLNISFPWDWDCCTSPPPPGNRENR